MRIATVCAAMLGIFLSLASEPAKGVEYPLQAAPVMALFAAVKESDVEAFKKAYSQRIREEEGQAGWDGKLKQAKDNLEKMYGDFQLSGFTYTFEGDELAGKVSATYKQGKALELAVIKDDGEWKIDMR